MIHTDSLNERQKEAVSTIDGPLLIVAGAGAGKTKTISHRILEIILKGANPESILAITFTNKSAKEMRERITSLIKNEKRLNFPVSNQSMPFMATFHSLGVHILRENAQLIGLNRNYSIFDRADSKRAVKEAMEIVGANVKEIEPNAILNTISRAKGEMLEWTGYNPDGKDLIGQVAKKVWPEYEKILKRDNSLDFDDLLLKTASLLKYNSNVKEYYSNIWKYIHIDEYQDTNKTQYEIARALAQKNRNICVVGDADQTIYSWRGANLQNILDFEKDYPDAKVVLLEENYRSTKNILEAANKIISKNLLRKEKRLFTQNTVGEKISLIENLTDKDEARSVADKINDLIEKGVEPKNIAILYRANFQSRLLEESLIRKSVPYQVLGTRFFERKEVKDILSYLRASMNESSTSDITRIINVPTRGIGKVTLAKLIAGNQNDLNDSAKIKVHEFFEILRRIKTSIYEKKASEAVASAIRESGMETFLRQGKMDDLEALENVWELASLASKYDAIKPPFGIEKLIEDAALATDQDEMEETSNAVKIMTVHASKGLEFDYVFITGLEKDLFPYNRTGDDATSEAESEEERRLFYVAITRAKKKVFLLFSRIRTIFGSERYNDPSEFIGDLDGALLEKEEVEEPTGVKAIFIDF